MSLRKTQFRKWLHNLDQKYAGNRRDCTSCPIATYLSERLDVPEVIVDDTHWKVAWTVGATSLPRWAKQFVKKVDSLSGKITTKTAIKYLEQV